MQDAILTTDLLLRLSDAPEDDARAAAGVALYRYNIDQTGIADRRPIAATLSTADTATVLGGLWGRTELGLLFLDMFYLPEHLREQGWGSQLLRMVEEEAVRRGCVRAVVETSSFQAPGFYQNHDYRVFGRIPFGISEHARIYLCKTLAS